MKLTRTAGYGIHAMAHIAAHDNGRPIIGHVAAAELGIPEGFLLRILVSLARAGLLRSVKGPNGGYNLGRPAQKITLLDMIEAAEGPLRAGAEPVSSPPDAIDEKLLALATAATEGVREALARVTLAELARGRKVKAR